MTNKEDGTTATKYERLISDLCTTVLEESGETDQGMRRAAAAGESLPEPWQTFTAKVRDEPSSVTDADVESLKAAGNSEDAIFEMTVAAAVGASLNALEAGLQALRADRPGYSLPRNGDPQGYEPGRVSKAIRPVD